MNRQPRIRAGALAIPLIVLLAACGGSGETTVPPAAPGSCEAAPPAAIDQSKATHQRHPVVLFVLNRGGEVTEAMTKDAEAVLTKSSERGATVVLEGSGGAAVPPLVLAGTGTNPSARHGDRCARLASARKDLASAMTAAAPAGLDVFGSLKTGFDAVRSLPGYQPAGPDDAADDVVVIGSAANTVGQPLGGEAVDQPAGVIRELSAKDLIRDCSRWRFTFAVDDASDSGQLGVGLREFWRQFAVACRGRVTGWSPTFEGFANKTLAAPDTVNRPEPAATTEQKGDTTKHVVGSSMLFEINSAQLSARARQELTATMRDVRTARSITVAGYTDATTVPGDPEFNERLSKARAEAVADLIRPEAPAGVAITVRGRGARDPIARDTDLERYRNRRVEIVITH